MNPLTLAKFLLPNTRESYTICNRNRDKINLADLTHTARNEVKEQRPEGYASLFLLNTETRPGNPIQIREGPIKDDKETCGSSVALYNVYWLAKTLLAGSVWSAIEATAWLWTIYTGPVSLADATSGFEVVRAVVRATRQTLVHLLVDLVTPFTLPTCFAIAFASNAGAVTTAVWIRTISCNLLLITFILHCKLYLLY